MSIINSQSKKQEKQEPPSCFYTLRLCNMRNSSLFSLRPIRYYNSAAAPGVCGLLLVCLVRDCEKIQQPMRMHGRQRGARRTGGEGGFFFSFFLVSSSVFVSESSLWLLAVQNCLVEAAVSFSRAPTRTIASRKNKNKKKLTHNRPQVHQITTLKQPAAGCCQFVISFLPFSYKTKSSNIKIVNVQLAHVSCSSIEREKKSVDPVKSLFCFVTREVKLSILNQQVSRHIFGFFLFFKFSSCNDFPSQHQTDSER